MGIYVRENGYIDHCSISAYSDVDQLTLFKSQYYQFLHPEAQVNLDKFLDNKIRYENKMNNEGMTSNQAAMSVTYENVKAELGIE